jgi:hypothetical protein
MTAISRHAPRILRTVALASHNGSPARVIVCDRRRTWAWVYGVLIQERPVRRPFAQYYPCVFLALRIVTQ